MAGARPIVDPPVFSSLPFGLWDAVQKPETPSHWQNGVTYIERCPQGDTTYDECISVTGTGAPPEPPVKTENVDQTFRGATPITVYARFDCSPIGIGETEEAAREALSRVENTQLEEAFWTGLVGGQTVAFPHLAASAEVVDSSNILLQTAATICTPDAGSSIVRGLGELTQCMAECFSGQGVIHVPPVALSSFFAWNLAIQTDEGLFTPAGHRIVVGTGYPGTSPEGTAPPDGLTWIYGTGPVFGYRGEVSFTSSRESFNRAENSFQLIAERTYVLGWQCCHFAALIQIST